MAEKKREKKGSKGPRSVARARPAEPPNRNRTVKKQRIVCLSNYDLQI